MSTRTNSKVPEIRFGEFSGEWRKQDLGDITTKIGSGKTPKGGKSVYVSSGMPLLRSQNILNDVVDFNGIVFISDKIDEEMSNSRVLKDDVLLNITGASIGRSAVYRSSKPANVNQHVCIIRANDESSPDFIQLNLTSSRGQKAIDSSQAGGGREGLNFQQIAKIGFQFPLLPEQEQIGSYFKSLDRMIGLHQRKHDKLVTLKQAMLQKMFPQDGATTPEIRFKGFDEVWSEKTLKEISRKVTDKNVQRGFSETLTNSAEYGIVSQRDYFDKDISNEANIDGYYVVEPDDFVYNPRVSTFAPCGPVNRNSLGRTGVMSPLYTVFRAYDGDNTFLEYFFKTRLWHSFMFLNGDTGARADRFSIKDSVFVEMPIPWPSLAEQQRVGEYFRNVDKLIHTHATQLEKLKNIKSACLEKMFV